jgi:hypothetical protein
MARRDNYVPVALRNELVEAALDQPNPTERLKLILDKVLKAMGHPDRNRKG